MIVLQLALPRHRLLAPIAAVAAVTPPVAAVTPPVAAVTRGSYTGVTYPNPMGIAPVTADGARETRAVAVAAFLKASGLQHGPVFHSGALRATQTAEILAGADGE
eukprot:tig00000076_g2344.t1